jgi:hypothetical protein
MTGRGLMNRHTLLTPRIHVPCSHLQLYWNQETDKSGSTDYWAVNLYKRGKKKNPFKPTDVIHVRKSLAQKYMALDKTGERMQRDAGRPPGAGLCCGWSGLQHSGCVALQACSGVPRACTMPLALGGTCVQRLLLARIVMSSDHTQSCVARRHERGQPLPLTALCNVIHSLRPHTNSTTYPCWDRDHLTLLSLIDLPPPPHLHTRTRTHPRHSCAHPLTP